MVYTYNEILSSLKKEGSSATCHSMGGPGAFIVGEINQVQKHAYCVIPRHKTARAVKLIEAGSGGLVLEWGHWENGELGLAGARVSVCGWSSADGRW